MPGSLFTRLFARKRASARTGKARIQSVFLLIPRAAPPPSASPRRTRSAPVLRTQPEPDVFVRRQQDPTPELDAFLRARDCDLRRRRTPDAVDTSRGEECRPWLPDAAFVATPVSPSVPRSQRTADTGATVAPGSPLQDPFMSPRAGQRAWLPEADFVETPVSPGRGLIRMPASPLVGPFLSPRADQRAWLPEAAFVATPVSGIAGVPASRAQEQNPFFSPRAWLPAAPLVGTPARDSLPPPSWLPDAAFVCSPLSPRTMYPPSVASGSSRASSESTATLVSARLSVDEPYKACVSEPVKSWLTEDNPWLVEDDGPGVCKSLPVSVPGKSTLQISTSVAPPCIPSPSPLRPSPVPIAQDGGRAQLEMLMSTLESGWSLNG